MILEIHPMTQADLVTAIGWAAAEGWNPGLADAGPFRAEDGRGFLMGWLGRRRRPGARRWPSPPR